MRRLQAQDGASLVEVLAAVTVFALIAAGTAAGTIASIRGSTASRSATVAAALIHDKIEQLRALDPATNPADLTPGAHVDPRSPMNELGVQGGIYTRVWTVVQDLPRRGLSTVLVTVMWNDGAPRTLRSGTYVCRTATCT